MGWTFNAADPNAPSDGPKITATAIIMTIFAFVIVTLRLYVRLRIVKAFGPDDWVIIYSWFASAGFAIISCVQTRWGLGLLSVHDFPNENIYHFGLLQYMGAPFYITSILGFKLALLLSYLRFIPSGAYRTATYVVIVLTVMFHLTFLLVQINLCHPVQAQWDTSIANGRCLPGVTVYTTMASLTIVFDVTVMLLPFPVLMSLNMQARKKLVLLGLFGMGIFITIIQIIRIRTIKRLVDYTDSAPLILWSTVETNLGILVASVPCLSPLVKYFRDRSTAGSRGRMGRTGYRVGSRYALQTWKSTQTISGMKPLGSSDTGNEVIAEATARPGDSDSMEFILEPSRIVRRTEITVTRT